MPIVVDRKKTVYQADQHIVQHLSIGLATMLIEVLKKKHLQKS